MTTDTSTGPRFAAITYARGAPVRQLLLTFADKRRAEGLNVQGLVQEYVDGPDGERLGVDAIDITTGKRIPLSRPTTYEVDNKVCSLDLSKLTEATGVLRRALDSGADVVVVERFGKTEKDGGGLADELLALMASGIPTLIAVPEAEREAWSRFTGDLGDVLRCDQDELEKWWAV
ncbi:DUF2478 domain-containing protein [Pseudomonadota bacterium]